MRSYYLHRGIRWYFETREYNGRILAVGLTVPPVCDLCEVDIQRVIVKKREPRERQEVWHCPRCGGGFEHTVGYEVALDLLVISLINRDISIGVFRCFYGADFDYQAVATHCRGHG